MYIRRWVGRRRNRWIKTYLSSWVNFFRVMYHFLACLHPGKRHTTDRAMQFSIHLLLCIPKNIYILNQVGFLSFYPTLITNRPTDYWLLIHFQMYKNMKNIFIFLIFLSIIIFNAFLLKNPKGHSELDLMCIKWNHNILQASHINKIISKNLECFYKPLLTFKRTVNLQGKYDLFQ